MKESLESLISAPLLDQVVARLVAKMHHILGILLTVVHDLRYGVNLRRIHLEALYLLVAVGLWSLGKLLGLGRGTTGVSTDIPTMLQMTLITTSHCLQERIPKMSEYKA
jgi:hypothetical protein